MVTHHIGEQARMYDMNTFFLEPAVALTPENALRLKTKSGTSGRYVVHGAPVTY